MSLSERLVVVPEPLDGTAHASNTLDPLIRAQCSRYDYRDGTSRSLRSQWYGQWFRYTGSTGLGTFVSF
jgi:hypothetical protein